MPIRVFNDLPVKKILEDENIFVMDEHRATTQDIRPLDVLILNLMPLKEDTELCLLRSLSNTPLQVNISFIRTVSYESKNVSESHLERFYTDFASVKNKKWDGLIITGAPVELMEFEDVDYWDELTEIMDWSKENVTSTLHICWGAQAGLYYHYGLQKHILPQKVFGVFEHKVMNRKIPIVRGFDDYFMAPHSRHTEVRSEDIHACKDLTVLAESDEVGVYLVMAGEGKQFFVMGHSEYDRLTLQEEYFRDLKKGMDIQVPKNYFPDDDPTKKPHLQWRSHSNNLYSNWLNYYVYQITPYVL